MWLKFGTKNNALDSVVCAKFEVDRGIFGDMDNLVRSSPKMDAFNDLLVNANLT